MTSSHRGQAAIRFVGTAEAAAASPGQRLVALRRRSFAPVEVAVFDSLEAVAETWRAFEASADCTVFQSFAWHSAWQAHIGARRGARPAIVVGRRGGGVLFILPLTVFPGRLGGVLRWSAGDVSDYNAPLLAPDFSRAVEREHFLILFEQAKREIAAAMPFVAVELDKMPEFVGRQKNPLMALPTEVHPDGAHRMALGAEWETFYEAKRSAGTRRNDRKKRKRLAEFGPVALVAPQTRAAIVANLETMFAQKSAALRQMGARDFFAAPGHRAFFTALATDPANAGLVHVSHLAVGESMAATAFGMVFGGAFYHLIAAYDHGPLSAWGPGAAQLRELIAYAIDRGCTTFDFTLGDESYKAEWCEVHLRLHDHRAAVKLRGAAHTLIRRAVAAAKRRVKQNPGWRERALRLRAKYLGVAPAAEKPAEEAPGGD